MAVTDYSRTPASNNSAPPNGAPEGWAPSAVNNTIRQIMTDIVNEASKGQAKHLGSVAGTDTITAVMAPALDARTAGMQVVFTPANTNTGAATLNIDSLGALDIQKFGGAALAAGDLVAGIPAFLILDSGADDWILLNPIASTAKYGDTTANFTGTLQYGGIEVGYRNLSLRVFSGADSTAATDAGKAVSYSGAGGHTFTCDSDPASLSILTVFNGGTGSLTVAASETLSWYNGSGSISTGSRTLAVGGVCTVYHTGGGSYAIWGTGIS